MRLLIGIVLTLVGGVVVVIGLGGALSELVGMYSAALKDAMAEGPEGKQVGANMMWWAIVGAMGALPLLVGSVILKVTLFAKVRRTIAAGAMTAAASPRRGGEGRAAASARQAPTATAATATAATATAATAAAAKRAEEGARSKPTEESTWSVPRRDLLGESGGNKSER